MDDYMSDSFITEASSYQPSENNCCRAPLNKGVVSSTLKRKRVDPIKPLKVTETEALKSSLSKPISEENKGFKLLKLMGYKEGEGLGPQNKGRVEPIPLYFKQDKGGVGKQEEMQRQIAENEDFKQTSLEDYQHRIRERWDIKNISNQLMESWALVVQFDKEKGDESDLVEEWERYQKRKEEKLEAQLKEGNERINERESKRQKPTTEDTERMEKAKQEKIKKLSKILTRLRSVHNYCFYCGESFASAEELSQKCPGEAEEDHS